MYCMHSICSRCVCVRANMSMEGATKIILEGDHFIGEGGGGTRYKFILLHCITHRKSEKEWQSGKPQHCLLFAFHTFSFFFLSSFAFRLLHSFFLSFFHYFFFIAIRKHFMVLCARFVEFRTIVM